MDENGCCGNGAIVIAALGLLVNYKKRTVITDEETGNKQKSPSHTLFLVPIEFWAILLPVLFLWLQNVTQEKDAENMSYIETPAINDIYSADFTKMDEGADEEYKYGMMKVVSTSPAGVEVSISKIAYDKKSGVSIDIREARQNDASYFYEEPASFTQNELLNLLSTDGIYSVER